MLVRLLFWWPYACKVTFLGGVILVRSFDSWLLLF
jgi:hypothetical protein